MDLRPGQRLPRRRCAAASRQGPCWRPPGGAATSSPSAYWLSSSYFPQVLTRDDAGNLAIWRNSSGGGVSAGSKIGGGWSNLNLTMVDFDGDGNQDILAQDAAGTMREYRSNGVGLLYR